ncbi:MAG: zinc-ribbon domain containing protein [Chloroflexi bacterium]|nr:zinc-ribbon domain containing protein [Chloroflexota bacterium]
MTLADKTLTCKDCGAQFVFTIGEQEFYARHGLQNEPRRCPECRSAKRNVRDGGSYSRGPRETTPAVCATCGKDFELPFVPRLGRPVYCPECFQKAKV